MNGLMIQGISSSSGKSFITTGLCRLFSNMNINICPFKSQNMSNNSFVTHDGLEISIAQAVQAQAAGLTPEVFMNPILLKPKGESSSEIILNGKVYASSTKDYRNFTQTKGIQAIRNALNHIQEKFEAVIIEGAGSPAEINLNAYEIVNMRIAREADVSVILVADVDKGGSLASVVGTLELLGNDRHRVKAIIFNKFRGDIELFKDAVEWTQNYTGIKVLGVVPFVKDINISGEDSLNIESSEQNFSAGKIKIGIPKFPSIANFSDFDAFSLEPDVQLIYFDENISVKNFHNLDAVILPGSKNTFAALKWLMDCGLGNALKSFEGFIFGICGGLQVLGLEIIDEDLCHIQALELMPLITSFDNTKITRQVSGFIARTNEKISGYEIHFGRTNFFYTPLFRELFSIGGKNEGIMRNDLRLAGTYLHGIFSNDNFRTLWLNEIRKSKNYALHETLDTRASFGASYDKIAAVLAQNLDVKFLLQLIHHEGTMLQLS